MLVSLSMNYNNSGSTHEELMQNLIRHNIIKDKSVEKAMSLVDRAHFVPMGVAAYEDKPQSIGYSASITSPYMHAVVLETLKDAVKPGSKVLDIGSGSGYLTACLALLAPDVRVVGLDYSVELVVQARQNVQRTGLPMFTTAGQSPVEFVVGDGREGYAAEAPYDCIQVGAAVDHIPQALIDQLAVGGTMMVPVAVKGDGTAAGAPSVSAAPGEQELLLLKKVPKPDGGYDLERSTVMTCMYAVMGSEPPQADTHTPHEPTLPELEEQAKTVSQQLKAWQAEYKSYNGVAPSSAQILADEHASELLKAYGELQKAIKRMVRQAEAAKSHEAKLARLAAEAAIKAREKEMGH